MEHPLRLPIVLVVLLAVLLAGCTAPASRQVVVYTSVDQVYADPILAAFERETGVRVRPVFDVEASKTTGLSNRLLAEAAHPQADVFWNGEFLQTILLRRRGVLAAYASPSRAGIQPAWADPQGYWTGMGARIRVLLVNKTAMTKPVAQSLDALLDPALAGGRTGIAYPLFGTAATHAAALYAALGPARGREFFEKLQHSGIRVVDGNSVVRDLVASGQLSVGLTDSDDACEAMAKGAPVRIVIPDADPAGVMVTPGTVALIRGAPHPVEARLLIDWLLAARAERRLIDSGFCQMSVRSGRVESRCPASGPIRAMSVSLEEIAAQYERSRGDMETIFVR